jgi:hypothetical protein
MEGTTEHSAHRPLGFGAAFSRQLGLLWSSRRPLLLVVALLALLVLSGEPWSSDPKARLFTLWPLWLTLVGPAWAFAVFYNEGPSSRLYHWSLPVGRAQHTLARVAAGLAWLWIAFAVLIAAGTLMALMDDALWQFSEISTAGWVNFFTGPLIGYLAVSLITVASDYPMRWFFGIVLVFPFTLSVLDEWLGLEAMVETILKPLTAEDWGLGVALLGGLGTAVSELDNTLRAMADPEFYSRGTFGVEYWWVATLLWTLIIGAAVVLLATRHPDRLPRLRRSG